MDTINQNSVTATIEINAKTTVIWKVLINPKYIAKYIGSAIQTDWKVGSSITWKGEMNGVKYENKGRVLEIVTNQLLRYSYWSGLGGDADLPENYSEITYHLRPMADNTVELTYSRINIPTEMEKQIFESHIQSVLDEIKKIAEMK